MTPGQRHQLVPTRTAKRLDHIQMVPAGAIEGVGKCMRIRADSLYILSE